MSWKISKTTGHQHTLDGTYLRRERVYNLRSQRFGELENQNDRELEPWQRGRLFLSGILLQQGYFLVNIFGGH